MDRQTAMTTPTTPGIAELLARVIDVVRMRVDDRCDLESVNTAINGVLAHVADLEAQRDEALKDAGRYRWLRAGRYPLHLAQMILNDTPEGIDAAIDEAIAQRGGNDV